MRKYVSISLFCLICFADFLTAQNQPSLLIRCDDIGMNHSVNMAIEQVLQTVMPVSASVMFACPWYQEAVAILKKYDNASVGIHLTLNAEWKFYRWGPVAGINKVPSLVDSLGYFYPTRASLFAARPSPAEVEIELRAQIERAVNSGVKIDYLDYHMGAAVQTEELRQIVEKLADEYQLGIAQYFGEKYSSVTYRAAIDAKTDSLVERVENLQPGEMSLQVIHIGLDTPEMRTLIDVNEFGPKDMSKQRAGELAALLSDDFQRALKEKQVRLVTYRDLIKEIGLKKMSRPVFTY